MISTSQIQERRSSASLTTLAFYFWALSIFRAAFALLFFRQNPVIATGVGSGLSVAFAYYLALWGLNAKDVRRKNHLPNLINWIVVYSLWCVISLVWTHAASLTAALGYWAIMVLDVVIMAVMFWWGDLEQVALASVKGIIVGGLLISLCAILTKSDDPNGRIGDLEFLHPGNVGKYAGQAALCSLYMWLRSRKDTGYGRWFWGGSTLFLSWVLLRSLSKTSIVALICSVTFYIMFSRAMALKTKVTAVVIAGLLLCVMYTVVNTYLVSYLEENPKDSATLTGRTVLWLASWEMIQDHPIVGYGFLSFRDYGPQDWDVRTTHGHNEWVTQCFQLGFTGLIITIGIYVSYFRHLRRATLSPQRELGIAMLIYMLIQGFAIAEPTGLMFPLPMMLLLATWACPGKSAAKSINAVSRLQPLSTKPAAQF